MSDFLSVRDLRVEFATDRGPLVASRGVSFDLEAGTSLGIVGESGSGKTVLSRATMGLLRGRNVNITGSVLFEGRELTTMSVAERRSLWGTHIAMIFQDPMTALNPVRRVGVQMRESLIKRLGMSKDESMDRSIELLKMVRMPDPESVLRKFPFELSGGMRQRVMIAMAISCKPKLLFADEPTTALDVTVQAQVLEILSDLRQQLNMAMVLITHDLGVVASHTDKIAVMYAGEMVELAETNDLFAHTKMPYTSALMNSIPRLDRGASGRMPTIEGRPPDPTLERLGCAFAPRCSFAQDRCRSEIPLLRESNLGHLYRCHFPLGGE